jgi:hypothetical protein
MNVIATDVQSKICSLISGLEVNDQVRTCHCLYWGGGETLLSSYSSKKIQFPPILLRLLTLTPIHSILFPRFAL